MGGCMGSPDSQTKVTLKHLITRLKTSVPIQKAKIERKLAKDETTLVQGFQREKKQRNKGIQQCQIDQIVYMRNMLNIWGVTQNCCTKIIDYYAVLQDPHTKNHIKNQIQMLLFLKSILNNKDLDQIYKMIIHRYKMVEPTIVDNEIVNYHKGSNSPNENMRNQYVMNLCTNGGFELAKINQVGHNFRYGI